MQCADDCTKSGVCTSHCSVVHKGDTRGTQGRGAHVTGRLGTDRRVGIPSRASVTDCGRFASASCAFQAAKCLVIHGPVGRILAKTYCCHLSTSQKNQQARPSHAAILDPVFANVESELLVYGSLRTKL